MFKFQIFYRLHPNFEEDVQQVESVLRAYIHALITGGNPGTSKFTKCLERLSARGYSSKRIDAIKEEAIARLDVESERRDMKRGRLEMKIEQLEMEALANCEN